MKSLKVVFAILALAIGFGAPIANAQDTKKQTLADKDKVAYSLTDDQYKKVSAIYKDAAAQKRALAADDTKKAKEIEINNATKAKVRGILTAEQQATFDAANKKPAKAKDDAKGKDAGKNKGGNAKKNKNAE